VSLNVYASVSLIVYASDSASVYATVYANDSDSASVNACVNLYVCAASGRVPASVLTCARFHR
jgi:hypothetical protein